MKLVPAEDFEMVKAMYMDVAENTPEIGKYARWSYGRHPTDESLRSYTDNGEMYVLTDEDTIAGITAIVMSQGQDYESVSWAEPLAGGQVATLHLLAVLPAYQGKNLGSKIIEEAVKLAKKHGKKAVRLDTLESNLPAQHMYEKAGFACRGKQYLYAENTGWTDFLFYEKKLD